MTQKDLKVRLARKKVEGITRDIATVQSKIQMHKEAGEQETGQEGIFQKLIDKYEVLQQQQIADNEKFSQLYDEFIEPIQSDESQAYILQTCQAIYNLLISLHYRKEDRKLAELELAEASDPQ